MTNLTATEKMIVYSLAAIAARGDSQSPVLEGTLLNMLGQDGFTDFQRTQLVKLSRMGLLCTLIIDSEDEIAHAYALTAFALDYFRGIAPRVMSLDEYVAAYNNIPF